MEFAACRGKAPRQKEGEQYRDGFFPSVGETAEEAILKFCFRCDVTDDCRDYADRIGATTGVWGGEQRTPPRK